MGVLRVCNMASGSGASIDNVSLDISIISHDKYF